MQWDRLHETQAPYVPRVTHELDTQNFEAFDEDMSAPTASGSKRSGRADHNFFGYTYKSYDAVDGGAGGHAAPRSPVIQRQVMQQMQSMQLGGHSQQVHIGGPGGAGGHGMVGGIVGHSAAVHAQVHAQQAHPHLPSGPQLPRERHH